MFINIRDYDKNKIIIEIASSYDDNFYIVHSGKNLLTVTGSRTIF